MSEPDPWTIGRLLEWTTDYLRQQGSDTPRLDAEVLLAYARDCQRIDLYTAFTETAAEEVRSHFRTLVKQRAEGTPVAHLVGQREFYSLMFRITPDVLIPRPETEFVVVSLLDRIKERGPWSRPVEIADVGTGSGIIAVCAARHVPNCRVTAIDVSPRALEIARENAVTHEVADRIDFVEGDLFDRVDPDRRFDFIASNPPYIGQDEVGTVASNVRKYEPHVALFAGPLGTEIIARLTAQAADRLRAGGSLIVEIGPMIHESVVELIAKDGRFEPAVTVKDLAKLPRVVVADRRPAG